MTHFFSLLDMFDPNQAQVRFRPPKLPMKRKTPYSRRDGNAPGGKKFRRDGGQGDRKGGKKFGGAKKVMGSKIKKKSSR